MFHRDTAKGSFNTPFAQAMSRIADLSRSCPGKAYVFTHDPVLTYLVERAGGKVSSPYAPAERDALGGGPPAPTLNANTPAIC